MEGAQKTDKIFIQQEVIKPFSIVLIQNKVTHDKKQNLERCIKLVENAIEMYNPNIVVLPEYFTTPTNLKNIQNFVEDEEDSEIINVLKETAKKYGIYMIAGTIPTYTKHDLSKIYNTCLCIDKFGEITSTFRKLHLFDIEIPGKIKFQESKIITPGDVVGVFETEYAKIGIGICYDIRFPEYCLLLRKEYDIDMMVFPAAFSVTTGALHWELLGRSRAVDNNVFVAMCSPARSYDHPGDYQAWGHSQVIDPFGEILASTGYEENIIYAKIDLGKNEEIRQAIPVWKQKRWDLYSIKLNK